MSSPGPELAHSRWRELIERPAVAASVARRTAVEPEERCELCAQPIPSEHRHLVDLAKCEILCACRPCALLFDREAAGGDHYRLVSERCLVLEGFRLDDLGWRSLRVPVEMAFFIRSGETGRVTAFYPSPVGHTESLLELETWSDIELDNPVLAELRPDAEALLVNRLHGRREHFIVGVDECYRLVALVRTHWRGLSGGAVVWTEIGRFFDALRARAETRA